MPAIPAFKKYERKITPIERFFMHSPFAIVTMVVQIKGNVTENDIRVAVSKVQGRHPNLRARIKLDENKTPWFTSVGVGDIPVKVVERISSDFWIEVVQEESQIPFEFEKRPAARFILVYSPAKSDLVILCHHIICDGMSLAILARDLMVHLGDPAREMGALPDPNPIDTNNIPEEVSVNSIARFFIKRINKKWERERIIFDQEDYIELTRAYWKKFTHQLLTIELSQEETSAFVERCRQEGVTVTSALTAAFIGAQTSVLGKDAILSSSGIGASLRDRLPQPAGEVMGFYAGMAELEYKYDRKVGFWENARQVHRKVKPLYNNQQLFKDLLVWCYLDPKILDSINFKKLGEFVPTGSSRYQKISGFSKRDDVVLSILKRDKMESLDSKLMGTAVTNLTRMVFPKEYGDLELERLIMKPGGGFPLVTVNLVVGAVTCAGKLSLLIEYVEDNIQADTMEKIKDVAMGSLLG